VDFGVLLFATAIGGLPRGSFWYDLIVFGVPGNLFMPILLFGQEHYYPLSCFSLTRMLTVCQTYPLVFVSFVLFLLMETEILTDANDILEEKLSSSFSLLLSSEWLFLVVSFSVAF
jgi:hypothetical protein